MHVGMDGGIERKNSMKQSDSNREKILFFFWVSYFIRYAARKKEKKINSGLGKEKRFTVAGCQCQVRLNTSVRTQRDVRQAYS